MFAGAICPIRFHHPDLPVRRRRKPVAWDVAPSLTTNAGDRLVEVYSVTLQTSVGLAARGAARQRDDRLGHVLLLRQHPRGAAVRVHRCRQLRRRRPRRRLRPRFQGSWVEEDLATMATRTFPTVLVSRELRSMLGVRGRDPHCGRVVARPRAPPWPCDGEASAPRGSSPTAPPAEPAIQLAPPTLVPHIHDFPRKGPPCLRARTNSLCRARGTAELEPIEGQRPGGPRTSPAQGPHPGSAISSTAT